MTRPRIDAAVNRMKAVRSMLNGTLEDLRPEEWFWQPAEGVTHVAWQAAHVAASQYALCLLRVRGVQASDQLWITDEFRGRYGRGSTPDADPAVNSSPTEIVRMLNAISEQSYSELALMSDSSIDVPLESPHPLFATRLAAVEYAASHELLHIGQITLLRRLMGRPPRM